MKSTRIRHLDGLRGIAIAAVLLYHAFERWADLVTGVPNTPATPLLEDGWLGVYLFFLISGFVILMTLEHCDHFGEFMWKRWTRLFPAMLSVSLIVYATAPWLPLRPAGMPNADDLLPGLLFIEPAWLEALLDSQVHSLEGAFWSIFVEVKFYVLSGLLYFFGGLVPMLLVLSALYAVFHLAARFHLFSLEQALSPLSAKYFGWFVAGALFYLCEKTRKRSHWMGATAFACLVAVMSISTASLKPALAVVALFALSAYSTRLQMVLSSPVLLFMGYISYALYLLHENMIIALTLQLKPWMPGINPRLLILGPIALAILLAYLVTRYLETPGRKVLARISESRFFQRVPR